jgi:S1-C subfamily serine protease
MMLRGLFQSAVLVLVSIGAVAVATVAAQPPPAAQPARYSVPELVRAMAPAVVFIGNADAKGDVKSIGSGFVVDPSGVIVTNFHVINGASGLLVKMKDGEIYDRVEVVDYDIRRDLAVLKIRAFKSLPTLALSEREVEPGEEAVAIGNPQGLEHTVSTGVVSAFRQAEGYRLMQISVPISPGSSGGPVFTMDGKVIGITSSGVVSAGAQNLNFAVPIGYVKPLLASKAAPVPIAEFTRKLGATTPPAPQSNASSASPRPSTAILGAWSVVHDHGDTFKTFCLGKFYLTADLVGFTNDSGIHNWEMPLSAVREAAKNAVYAADKKAFHIRLTTGTNYNFIAVDDQLRYAEPDIILIAIMKVKK